MTNTALLLLPIALAGLQAAEPAPPAKSIAEALSEAAPGRPKCDNDDPDAVVVCGRSHKPYRIDPVVLATTRAAEAPPSKPPLDAAAGEHCVGPNCGGGSYVPLVGMALTAIKAVELAAQGDDWRDAFRTRPDEYRVYRQVQAKQAKRGGVSVGVSVGNSARPR